MNRMVIRIGYLREVQAMILAAQHRFFCGKNYEQGHSVISCILMAEIVFRPGLDLDFIEVLLC